MCRAARRVKLEAWQTVIPGGTSTTMTHIARTTRRPTVETCMTMTMATSMSMSTAISMSTAMSTRLE